MTDGVWGAIDQRSFVQRRASPLRWFVLAVCLMAGASVLPSPAAAHADALASQTPGGIGVRLLDTSAATADDPRSRLYIIDHLPHGTVIERRIEVANTTAAPAAVRLYAAGASIVDGTFTGDPGDSPNELSTWNTVRPSSLDLDAGAHAIVTVTIAVPLDAAPGERYAVVWAAVHSEPSSGGVAQINRVGVRQYLPVGPGGPPAADFTIDTLTAARAADGTPMVLATVRNTGGRALDMAGELELLDGPAGLHAGPFPARLGSSLAIGESGQVTIPLDEQIPAGPWEATITLHSGLLERSAQSALTFPSAGSAAPVPATPNRDRLFVPITVGLLLVLLSTGLLWNRSRGRRATEPANAPSVHAPLVTTQSLHP